nr:hypothetical protein [Tanacetum cinerariifolium]
MRNGKVIEEMLKMKWKEGNNKRRQGLRVLVMAERLKNLPESRPPGKSQSHQFMLNVWKHQAHLPWKQNVVAEIITGIWCSSLNWEEEGSVGSLEWVRRLDQSSIRCGLNKYIRVGSKDKYAKVINHKHYLSYNGLICCYMGDVSDVEQAEFDQQAHIFSILQVRLLPHARGLGFKPRRGGFPSGAKNEWGLSPKAKVQVLHTAQLDVTVERNRSIYVYEFCVIEMDVHGLPEKKAFRNKTFLGIRKSVPTSSLDDKKALLRLNL